MVDSDLFTGCPDASVTVILLNFGSRTPLNVMVTDGGALTVEFGAGVALTSSVCAKAEGTKVANAAANTKMKRLLELSFRNGANSMGFLSWQSCTDTR